MLKHGAEVNALSDAGEQDVESTGGVVSGGMRGVRGVREVVSGAYRHAILCGSIDVVSE